MEQHEPTEEERIAAEKEAERLRRKRESNRKYMKKIREKSKEFAEHDMALVTKIKEYREQAGYKQSELAELVGARRETIVHLENGRYNPSLKLAMDIAKVFHVTVEELFEFVEDEK